MKFPLFAICLLCFAQLSFPGISGASISMLVSRANSTTTAYSVPYETRMGGHNYYLVLLGGNTSAYAELWQEGGKTFGRFVSDKQEALALVNKNLQDRNANSSVQSLAMSASSRLAGLDSNFTSTQKECRRIMGLDRQECNSYASCLKACNGVPSFCMQVAAHLGDRLIYALWQYENDTGAFFDLVKKERAASVVAANYPSESNLEDYAEALERLDEVGMRLSKTGLLVSEMYCAPPFSAGLIGASRVEVAQARDLLFEMRLAPKAAALYAQAGATLQGNSPAPFDVTPNIQKKPPGSEAANSSSASLPAASDFNFAALAPYAAIAIILAMSASFIALKKLRK